MRYEEVRGVTIPKVGFGTWNFGGGSSAEPHRDGESLKALRSALDVGYTHFDTAEAYADGHCEELLGIAIREAGFDRSKLFLTTKVRAANLRAQDAIRACEGSLRRLGTGYVDLYLIHWPSPSIRLEETFSGLNELLENGKVRYIGVSNFDLALLRRAVDLAAAPIFTNQVPLSVRERAYIKNGVLDFCQSTDILLTAYSPLKGAARDVDPEFAALALKRNVTPFELSIAWLCSQPRVITIPSSFNPAHQRANLDSADIVLTPDELASVRA